MFWIRSFTKSIDTFARNSSKTYLQSLFLKESQISVFAAQQIRKMSSSPEITQDRINFDEKDKFVTDVFNMAMEKAVKACRDRTNPVVRFKTPEELKSVMDFSLSLTGVKHSELADLCAKTIENSVLTGHPQFCNQQIGGLNHYGLAGEVLLSALNTNALTFEISPVFSVAETVVLEHVLEIAGYRQGEGTFCPGGSHSNMLAMNVAKVKRFPESKNDGITGLPRLVSFCSEQAHYSAKKNSALLGFGEKNCVSVKCDERGKMIPEELEKMILKTKEAGDVPLFVTATAGTTVLGAFDSFNKIADVCEKHKVWMHVDGAWGASALLSKKHRHLCDGTERADSLAWNFHKMLSAPIQCSVLLLKEKGLFTKTHSIHVPYLFQEGKPYDQDFDLGRKLIQCGRRADAFKLWLMWKAMGDKGMEEHVDRAFDNAQYFLEQLKTRENFRLVIPQIQCPNVSFWYIPPSLRGKKEDEDFFKKVSKIIPQIKLRMQKAGSLLIGFSPIPGVPTFFRMTVMNGLVTHEDMDFALNEIEKHGRDF